LSLNKKGFIICLQLTEI